MNYFYAAPMEGVTGFAWRKAHDKVFGGVDRYFTPFISPNQNHEFQTKELRDVSQGEEKLVPQILTNKAEHFIWAAKELQAMGYEEVNLNLGCPSKTVITKNKGSGFLRDAWRLDRFLCEIYDGLPDMKISIKTRVGVHDEDSWPELLEVFERYPVYELIVHPRISDQQYKGTADRELFKWTVQHEKQRIHGQAPQNVQNSTNCMDTEGIYPGHESSSVAQPLQLVYNGDVFTPDDEAFSYDCSVMAGRGLISDPALFRKARMLSAVRSNTPDKGAPCKDTPYSGAATSAELREFHELLLDTYITYMPGELPIVHRMKEFWFYYISNFQVPDSLKKALLKAKTLNEFNSASNGVLDCPLRTP